MKYVAEIGTKGYTKDSKGNVIKGSASFSPVKTIRIDMILPFGSESAKKAYGLEIQSTHRTTTYDEVEVNSYLRFQNKVYWIKEVIRYPRANQLVMELIP